MSKLLAVGLLSMVAATAANARDGHDHGGFFDRDHGSKFMAPEIDPSSAVSALTLLLGGLTVLRGRFGKR